MSQTPSCPDVPSDVRALADNVAMEAVTNGPGRLFQFSGRISDAIARAILADRASRALPSTALAARPEEGWKPIKTAPKDGRDIIVYDRDVGGFEICWWCAQKGKWLNDRWGRDSLTVPEGVSERELAGVTVELPVLWCPMPPLPPTAGDGHD